jgi:hypothetical protein
VDPLAAGLVLLEADQLALELADAADVLFHHQLEQSVDLELLAVEHGRHLRVERLEGAPYPGVINLTQVERIALDRVGHVVTPCAK